MNATAPNPDEILPIIEPRRDRQHLVSGLLQASPSGSSVAFHESARDVPEGKYLVGAVSLGLLDPVAEARYLVLHRGVQSLLFYGEESEREAWSRRISYELFLPRHRVVVPLKGALTKALDEAIERARQEERAQPILDRVDRDRGEFGRAVEATILDALSPPGDLREAYAAVIRGSLGPLSNTADEFAPNARRALQSALRRIELLRGRDERDRVAGELREVFARFSSPSARSDPLDIGNDEELAIARETLGDRLEGEGLDAEATRSVLESVSALSNASLAAGRRCAAGVTRNGDVIVVSWSDSSGRHAEFFMR